jgi:O-antigen ligase
MLTVPFLAPFKAPPVASFHPEAIAAAFGLLALSVLPLFASRLELPQIGLLPLGLTAVILIQLMMGKLVFHQVGLLAALYLLWATALIGLGGLLRRELGLQRVAAHLAWFVLAGAVLSAVVGWAQHIDSDALGSWMMPRSRDRIWANLGQSNQLADYLTLGLASAAYLFATGRMKLRWALPALLALTYILLLTGSRTSWVYLIALTSLSGIFFGLERSRTTRRLLAFSGCALVALPLLSWLVQLTTPAGTDPLPTAGSRIEADVFAAEERPRLWKAAWMIFERAPIWGVGLRQFGWNHFVVSAELPAPRVLGFTDHAHNLLLQVLAELGVVGFAVLLVPLALWLARVLRVSRSPEHWWIWATTLVIAVHSMLEYPLWYTFFLGAAALVVGMADPRTIKLSLFHKRSGRWLLIALLAGGWLVLGQLVRDYLFLENFLAFRYRYMHATAEVNQQAKEVLLAIHRGSLLAPYIELGLSRAISIDRERLEDKLKVNGRAMRLFATDDMVYREAMLLALHGEQGQARVQWDRAAASYPEDEQRALRVLTRRVEDGLNELEPLRQHASSRALEQPMSQSNQ